MSDEEPPTKITRIELSSKHMDISEDPADSQGEGQEEWLSEGVLTDDDYPTVEQDKYKNDSNLGNTSLDDSTMQSGNENLATVTEPLELLQDTDNANANTSAETVDGGIEQTLNELDNDKDSKQGEVDTFFQIRKVGNTVTEPKTEAVHKGDDRESELDESAKQSDEYSDGHNTDELLKMLSEGNNESKKKSSLKTVQVKKPATKHDSTDDEDDDDYIFEGAKVTQLKVAKNVLIRKGPVMRAQPEEDDSDSDFTSDEASTVKNMFQVKKKISSSSIPMKMVPKPSDPKPSVTIKKHVVKIPSGKPSQSKPAKPPVRNTIPVKAVHKPAQKPQMQLKMKKPEHEEIIEEEDFMEDDDFSLDEEEFAELREGDKQRSRQRIMKPEEMDEEIPTDGESHDDDDGSFYDELPSSESDEMEDWFTLDIRAERAGDYLPLLGSEAYQLLTGEKKRVASRLSVLRQSLSALTESGKLQAEKIRRANITLAELDAALAAS